MSTIVDIPQL